MSVSMCITHATQHSSFKLEFITYGGNFLNFSSCSLVFCQGLMNIVLYFNEIRTTLYFFDPIVLLHWKCLHLISLVASVYHPSWLSICRMSYLERKIKFDQYIMQLKWLNICFKHFRTQICQMNVQNFEFCRVWARKKFYIHFFICLYFWWVVICKGSFMKTANPAKKTLYPRT